jgi:DNA-nicking Smr family endonuclease
MTKPRRSRQLSPEERKLWAHVARSAKPLPGRQLPEIPEPGPGPAGAIPAAAAEPGRAGAASRPAKPSVPALAPLERRTLVALRRGRRALDGVIDLHGMRQAEAHGALIGFLRRAQAAGHGLVLVITGKGAGVSGALIFEERGVLRRSVPHWLRMPELRALVLGFEEALPQHGGSGALYVRLRRRPGSERSAGGLA